MQVHTSHPSTAEALAKAVSLFNYQTSLTLHILPVQSSRLIALLQLWA